ncbi:MAG TPA: universal stress protein, partial [Vicinamibacterales bacterium]|nr:universal stress protein [Vicinamibacterales bacterium]
REIEENAQKRLQEAIIDSDGSGPHTVPLVMTSSAPAFAIIDYAREHGVDLIIMGTHGRGALGHILMGSVAERVVRLAPCPVLTVRTPERDFVHPDNLVPVRERAGAH